MCSTPQSTAKRMALKKKLIKNDFLLFWNFSKYHGSVINCNWSIFKLLSNHQKKIFSIRISAFYSLKYSEKVCVEKNWFFRLQVCLLQPLPAHFGHTPNFIFYPRKWRTLKFEPPYCSDNSLASLLQPRFAGNGGRWFIFSNIDARVIS